MGDENDLPQKEPRKKKKKGVSQGVYFDEDVLNEVEKRASASERSISYVVNKALRKVFGLDKDEK